MPTRHKPDRDNAASFDEHAAVVSGAEHEAAGVKAVMVSLHRGLKQMGPVRTAAALSRLNQRHGFDCPGCAWPEEPGGRKLAEFCENGAKAVAEEATKRRVTPDFFARHSVADLADQPEYWLSQQGRITHPMVLRRRRHALPADRMGRRLPLDRRTPQRPRQPGRGVLLHVGAHQQRGRVPVSAAGPQLRHQQPAGLLQHVPRVLGHRADGLHRHRQGLGDRRGRRGRRLHPDRRSEPRHQPSPDAVDPGEGQGATARRSSPSTRCRRRA